MFAHKGTMYLHLSLGQHRTTPHSSNEMPQDVQRAEAQLGRDVVTLILYQPATYYQCIVSSNKPSLTSTSWHQTVIAMGASQRT